MENLFLSPASLEHAELTETDNIWQNAKNNLKAFLFERVISANSAGSARDKGFFLSPASLEHAELTETDNIWQNAKNNLKAFLFERVVSARDKDWFDFGFVFWDLEFLSGEGLCPVFLIH
ncbi:MAG: hypothetical protein AMJ94_14605 [Deltaproteobacteria bacterium SM23_61]|nr:MAG: hypothetical protein AMJ94_14605 [Deltaproteobacteria bacterium SM23_61]